ncbi:tetratricopeptide [Seiridium cupressi]
MPERGKAETLFPPPNKHRELNHYLPITTVVTLVMGGKEEADASTAASAARDRGNALYRAGKLTAAETAYTEAARLAPKDPRPVSNVSAVKFEMGNYIGAAIFSEKALKLLQNDSDPALEQKIRVRLAESYLYARKPAQAKTAVSEITAENDRRQLEHSISAIEASDREQPDIKKLRIAVIEKLPRFKVALQNEPEYFSVGHDGADTLLDDRMADAAQDSYSFLLAGVGDGRNVFATLAFISLMALSKPPLLSKKFHFTLLDIKPAVLARDLLMFRLLLDAAKESSEKSSETLVTLSYLFAAQLMPDWSYARLQTAIKDLIGELQKPKADIMTRFYVDSTNRAQICHHLRNWQKPPQQWYGTSAFIQLTQSQGLSRRMKTISEYGIEDEGHDQAPPGCEDRKPGCTRKLDQYLEDQWKPNMTLIGFDYEEKRQGKHMPLLDFTPHGTVSDLFAHIPHLVAGEGVRGVLPHLEGFFRLISGQLTRIWDQTTFEIVIDDMVNYLERAEYGLLHRADYVWSLRPTTFPDRFDRIDMSNIPDYVAGPLTTFIHGIPILRSEKTSTMSSYVLRNTTLWTTHNQFLTEYLLLADRSRIANTFSATLTQASTTLEQALDGTLIGGQGAIMSQPMSWMRTSSKPLEWSKLMPRRDLERWLHAYFLKICLPFPHATVFEDRIIRPLNLLAIFRLIAHLFKVGYPAHWLSDILVSLITEEITTTARPPRSTVTDAAEATAVYPATVLSVRTFITEFRTLLSIWQRLLPFGLLQQKTTKDQLPSLDAVRQFEIKFEVAEGFYDLTWAEITSPHSILVLWNRTVNGEVPVGKSLRATLLDDESVK